MIWLLTSVLLSEQSLEIEKLNNRGPDYSFIYVHVNQNEFHWVQQ